MIPSPVDIEINCDNTIVSLKNNSFQTITNATVRKLCDESTSSLLKEENYKCDIKMDVGKEYHEMPISALSISKYGTYPNIFLTSSDATTSWCICHPTSKSDKTKLNQYKNISKYVSEYSSNKIICDRINFSCLSPCETALCVGKVNGLEIFCIKVCISLES